MPRPHFTKNEEALIAYIRAHDVPRRGAMLEWSCWILLLVGLFVYGLLVQVPACLITSFILILWLLCRFVHAQVRPDWNMKPIFDKYEEMCENQSEPPA